MEDVGINFYPTKNPDTKAAIAERVIRTLKGRIYRYLTKHNTKTYLDVLKDIVIGYNTAKHRSIGTSPANVTKDNEKEIRQRLYPGKIVDKRRPKFPFHVGDSVRLAKEKTAFQKGYLPLWTEEVFTVAEILPRDPPVAKVKDLQGQPVEGTFYKEELQKITLPNDAVFRVEEVLDTRTDSSGAKSYLVKWLGYPSTMNSWVAETDMLV